MINQNGQPSNIEILQQYSEKQIIMYKKHSNKIKNKKDILNQTNAQQKQTTKK